MELQKTFWGLVIEQGKQYKQTPTFNFHVSKAVLDLEGYDKKPVSVKVQVDNGEFILCNLTENESQANLDLVFGEGEKIKFFASGGKANVHLTGYLMPEDALSQLDDEEFSDEDVSEDEQMMMNHLNQLKRKNTETVKLTGKDSKKMKTDDKAVEANAKKQKIVDVDPKQLLNKKDNKEQDNQQNKKKDGQQQQKNKVQMNNKLATKGLEMDSDSDNDDDLSIDEDGESVDLNAMMDEENSLIDEDLDSDDDLESDDDDELDLAKLNKVKNKVNKPNQQANKQQQQQGAQKNKQQNRPNQQMNKSPQKNGPFNKEPNKTPQQMNKNTPNQNKNQQKPHQQTPFHQNKNSNKKHQGTPFQSGNKGNKSFGSQNKQAKKVFN